MEHDREALRQMTEVFMRVVTRARQVERKSTDASRLSMLSMIARYQGLRPSELATALNMHNSQLSRQLRVLEVDGFVELTVQPDDRRTLRITLTEAGGQQLEKLIEVGLERFAGFVQDWPDRDVRDLTSLLGRLEAAMVSERANRDAVER